MIARGIAPEYIDRHNMFKVFFLGRVAQNRLQVITRFPMMPTNVSGYPPSVCVTHDRFGFGGKCGAHKLTAVFFGLLRQIFFEQIWIRDAVRVRKQAESAIRCGSRDVLSRRLDLCISIDLIVNADKRTFQLLALGDSWQRLVAMIPTMIRNMDKSRCHGRLPPTIAPPATPEDAGAIQNISSAA